MNSRRFLSTSVRFFLFAVIYEVLEVLEEVVVLIVWFDWEKWKRSFVKKETKLRLNFLDTHSLLTIQARNVILLSSQLLSIGDQSNLLNVEYLFIYLYSGFIIRLQGKYKIARNTPNMKQYIKYLKYSICCNTILAFKKIWIRIKIHNLPITEIRASTLPGHQRSEKSQPESQTPAYRFSLVQKRLVARNWSDSCDSEASKGGR